MDASCKMEDREFFVKLTNPKSTTEQQNLKKYGIHSCHRPVIVGMHNLHDPPISLDYQNHGKCRDL